MSDTTSLPTLPAFQMLGQSVELTSIEKELQALFMDGSEEDDGVTGIARASLINLALYNEDPEGLERDASVLAELTSESACRSMLICSDTKTVELSARAWVQAHCQIDRSGNKTVCTEQLSFYLTGNSRGLVRNIVFANLDSDLPLAFWWRGEFSEVFEERLYSRIDRLLFDSESWESPRNQLLRLMEARQQTSASFVMHDLAFTRLNLIRHAVANAFDRPAVSQQVPSLQRIILRYAPGFRMSSLYLAAWIAMRLEATIDHSQSTFSKIVLSGRRRGGPHSFVIEIGELDEDRKGTIEADFEMDGFRVEISRCQTRSFFRTLTHRADGSSEEDWLPARQPTDVVLVSDVLNRAGHNRTHAGVLPMVLDLLTLP
ncbi:MAG: glucose-6-phosphate dehydrogenase assembly protein OpcA [Verrucomicrobiota bacterium]